MTERRRRILNRSARASCVIAIVCVLVAMRSYWRADSFVHVFAAKWSLQIDVAKGGIYLTALDDELTSDWMPAKRAAWGAQPASGARLWPEWSIPHWEGEVFLGLAYMRGNGFSVTRIPLIGVAMVCGLFAFWWMRHPQSQRRVLYNTCINCGYDLRGSSGRCPECGREFIGPVTAVPPPPARSKSAK